MYVHNAKAHLYLAQSFLGFRIVLTKTNIPVPSIERRIPQTFAATNHDGIQN
jgi:hypothetical protein